MKEFKEKIGRLNRLMEEEKWDGVVLTRQHNFSWLTCGGENFVAVNSEEGIGYLLVEKEKVTLFTSNIEALRLKEEELGELPIEVQEIPWWKNLADSLQETVKGKEVAWDSHPSVEEKITPLRYSLTASEVERYFVLGRECARELEWVLMGVKEGVKEREVAGRISKSLLSLGISPVVILVAADERIEKFRHPLPTDNPLKKMLMGVVCGRRGGLTVSVTRLISLGKVSAELERKHRAVCYVDTVFISSTVVGRSIGEIFKEGVKAYTEQGYPEEWKKHHQGGPTGYRTREFKATKGENRKVEFRQAFAWNPSITGTKSEDTIIAYDESPLIVTSTPTWPKVKVEYGRRIWERPDILAL